MAKGPGNKGDGRSKIRVVVIEADLAEGELRDMTQAITNALRPAPVVQRFITSGPATPAAPQLADAEDIEDAEVIEEVENAPAPRTKASSKPRRYPPVKVLTDVDLESDVSFPDFAAGKKPKNIQDRYLVAAAWYKLHRDTDAITMHHVYTCFLHPRVKWPTGMADFDQPLRQLVKRNRLGRGERSHYVINHIGLADVDMLGTDSD